MVEKDRRSHQELAEKRAARAKEISALIERVSKRGEPYSYRTHQIPDKGIVHEGYRYRTGGLTISARTETIMSHGVGSDDLASFATQDKFFEVIERGRQVFLATARTQSNSDGGPLQLNPDPKTWAWFLLKDTRGVRPKAWEKIIRRIAKTPQRTKPKTALVSAVIPQRV